MSYSLLELKGVGEKSLLKLRKIGIKTVEDLLFHLPIRYQDKTKITNISNTEEGKKYLLQGVVEKANIAFYKRRMLVVRVSDKTGFVRLRFFYFNKSQIENFKIGSNVRCYGEIRLSNKVKEIVHPECQFFKKNNAPILEEYLTPIYPVTDGLNQNSLRKIIKQSLVLLKNKKISFPELLPKEVLKKYKLIDVNSAIFNIHNPDKNTRYEDLVSSENKNKKRLVFEELLSHQLVFKRIRSFSQKK